MSRARRPPALLAVLLLAVAAASCRREEKPPVRTEPWPAPGVSGSATRMPGRARYTVTRGKATIEVSVSKRRVHGELTGFDGTLDVDFDDPRRTRGRLRADLRSLTLKGDNDAPDLGKELKERLGLREGSDQHRYADFVLTAIEPRPQGSGLHLAAQGELTMHGFRVPVVLELSVDRGAAGAGSSEALRVRTRRPLLIPLMAYGLVPGAAPDPAAANRVEIGREASVSAEIEAEPAPDSTAP